MTAVNCGKKHKPTMSIDNMKSTRVIRKIARIDTAHHAQYLTGDMYLKGLGGEIDYDKALKLFHQSATGGNTYAENNIGFMYTYGLGVTKDYSQAFKWLNKAATQGNPEAQIGMGSLYKNGWEYVKIVTLL